MLGKLIECTQIGMNAKFQADANPQGRRIHVFETGGPDRDYIGAELLLDGLPEADWMLVDQKCRLV